MKEWMLTNKEIHKALGWTNNFESLCEAQTHKIARWLNESCPHSEPLVLTTRRECDKCMEELCKGVELAKPCGLCGNPLESGELNPHKDCVDREKFLADRK
jgi:hypothetical protein